MITNLAQELTLVDRMQDALSGEMVRRQELLREAGNFASIRDYEKARAAGEDLVRQPGCAGRAERADWKPVDIRPRVGEYSVPHEHVHCHHCLPEVGLAPKGEPSHQAVRFEEQDAVRAC